MAATAGIIAAAIGAAGSIVGGVANAAHGGPPSPLAQQPGGARAGYQPTAMRLSDIMAAKPDDEEQMRLRMIV